MLYPDGYGTRLVTLDELEAKHGPRMHPTFRRQLFAYLAHKGGLMGIGGGWRAGGTQPDKPGFAPEGRSFHQDQQFASGTVGYCAVDLVMRNGARVHRAPTWAETADAPAFQLHTFITGEPWHIQPINIRGWQSWVNDGRPDPQPSQHPIEEDDMPKPDDVYIAVPPATRPGKPWLVVERYGGGVRYAMNEDESNPAIKQVPTSADQYDWLYRSVFGR